MTRQDFPFKRTLYYTNQINTFTTNYNRCTEHNMKERALHQFTSSVADDFGKQSVWNKQQFARRSLEFPMRWLHHTKLSPKSTEQVIQVPLNTIWKDTHFINTHVQWHLQHTTANNSLDPIKQFVWAKRAICKVEWVRPFHGLTLDINDIDLLNFLNRLWYLDPRFAHPLDWLPLVDWMYLNLLNLYPNPIPMWLLYQPTRWPKQIKIHFFNQPDIQTVAGSILGSGKILSLRLVMKSGHPLPIADSNRAVVSYWQKDEYLVRLTASTG